MSKYVKLSESQLVKIIQKVINEQDETNFKEPDPKLFALAMSNSKPGIKSDSQQSSLAEEDDDFEDDDFEDDDF
jgi:hypothetical protein